MVLRIYGRLRFEIYFHSESKLKCWCERENSAMNKSIVSNEGEGQSFNNMGTTSISYVAGLTTLKRFVTTSCIASETTYDEHVTQYHGADRWSCECIPPVLVRLKSEAKTLGLWNLFAPLSFRRQFSSSTSTPPPSKLAAANYPLCQAVR